MRTLSLLAVAASMAAACGSDEAGTEPRLVLLSVSPAAHALAVPVTASVALDFDRPVRRDSLTSRSLRVFGRWSGPAAGILRFENEDRRVVFTPERGFSAGELVSVTLAGRLAAADGTLLRSEGHSFSFWTRTLASGGRFSEAGRLSARVFSGQRSQAYGGVASDLDGDGRLDLTIVNELTADVVAFLNEGDFHFRAAGRAPVGRRASPSEPADFDADGRVDLAVANIDADSVSILLGTGDGRFTPAQTLAVGAAPRGLAVLDADGDGDTDIASAGFGASRVTLLLNDGAGRFVRGAELEAGVDGEWALTSADMDADGLLDLVVGGQLSQQVAVLRGRGDGRFEPASRQLAGGAPWMLVAGDLDADGDADVATVNGRTDTASILRGDGRGGLAAARVYTIAPFGLASDLGDLDGDGDLDWLTSSYAGEWRLFRNAGDGNFDVRGVFRAPQAASCALPFDADGDGDLDLALIDEVADEVVLIRNEP